MDKEYKLLTFNKFFSDFVETRFGTRASEGDDIRQYLHEDNLAGFNEDYQQALSGKYVSREFSLHYPESGKTVHWYTHFEPAHDSEGQIIGVSFNAMDITDKVIQDELLRKQNESLREITFYQSHELRRPVSSVLGLIDYITEKHGHTMGDELGMLQKAASELDEKIKMIIKWTNET